MTASSHERAMSGASTQPDHWRRWSDTEEQQPMDDAALVAEAWDEAFPGRYKKHELAASFRRAFQQGEQAEKTAVVLRSYRQALLLLLQRQATPPSEEARGNPMADHDPAGSWSYVWRGPHRRGSQPPGPLELVRERQDGAPSSALAVPRTPQAVATPGPPSASPAVAGTPPAMAAEPQTHPCWRGAQPSVWHRGWYECYWDWDEQRWAYFGPYGELIWWDRDRNRNRTLRQA